MSSNKPILLLLVSLMLLSIACRVPKEPTQETRTIMDGQGRTVRIPTKINKIGALRPGALRLMCYLQATDKVAFIERNEIKRITPYILAYPELKELEILGAGNNIDPELLAASNADVIISTYMSVAEADVLQEKSKKPVITLLYGDLGEHIEDYYNSLALIGDIAEKKERASDLIQYTKRTITELQTRVAVASKDQSAYIGGIAFNGALGIGSSRVFYPPLTFLDIESPVDKLQHSMKNAIVGHKNILIDTEQIVDWDTDFIFLDAAGEYIWKSEVKKSIFGTLKAVKNGNMYSILPFNWHTINFENLLCNAWFIGTVVYPNEFADIDPTDKSREVFKYYLGTDIYPEMNDIYVPYRQVKR